MAGNDQETVEIITKYFESVLAPKDKIFNVKTYPPKEMSTPFTAEEIRDSTKGMKNGKAAGPDDLKPELIKYAPELTHDEIAKIINEIAKTGEHPEEINLGILSPIIKDIRKKGQCKKN